MKKNLTLLMIAAASLSFAQVQKMNSVVTLTDHNVSNVKTQNKADEMTYSQVSSDELSASISVLSCQDIDAPVQISRGYDMQADYGINVPFTVTKINVAAKAYAGSTVEGMIINYNGEWSDFMQLSDSEDTDGYGAMSFDANADAKWYDMELFDPYTVPAGQKFLTSIVAPIGPFTTDPTGSFIPWYNVDGATQTRPSWYGGNYGACGLDEDGNYVNVLTNGFPDVGVILMKITGYAEDLGTVEVGGNELRAFPNPASSEITVTLKDSKIADINLADAAGRIIPARVSVDGKVDVSSLSPGVYFLRVKDDKGVTRIQKIIKK